MHIEHYHRQLSQKLTDSGSDTAALDARLLICHFLQLDLTQFIMQQQQIITPAQLVALDAATQQALADMPISRILQIREFWGLDFVINQHVLDPRADSEILIETILQFVAKTSQKLNFLDLGTGTGCLLLSLLHEYQNSTGVGVDFSVEALRIAHQNAKNLHLSERVSFIESDWFKNIPNPTDPDQKFDVILSNPPYIPSQDIEGLADNVKLYDPLSALDGGEDGLAPYRIIASQAAQYLKPNGILIFEMGFDQADGLFDILNQNGFSSAEFNLKNSFANIPTHSPNGLGYDLGNNPRIIISRLN